MIEIKNIYAGWLTFELHYGMVSQLFTVSYLNDFRDDINYLLGVGNEKYFYKYKNEMEIRAIMLDGEGSILKLSIMKNEFEDEAVITWWLNDDVPVVMVFDYHKLVNDWIKEMDKHKDIYDREYLIDYDDEE